MCWAHKSRAIAILLQSEIWIRNWRLKLLMMYIFNGKYLIKGWQFFISWSQSMMLELFPSEGRGREVAEREILITFEEVLAKVTQLTRI